MGGGGGGGGCQDSPCNADIGAPFNFEVPIYFNILMCLSF